MIVSSPRVRCNTNVDKTDDIVEKDTVVYKERERGWWW